MDYNKINYHFLSTITINKKIYSEFRQVYHRQSLPSIIIIWGLYLISTIIQLIIPGLNKINLIYPAIVSIFYIARFIWFTASVNSGYKRLLATNDNNPITYVTSFYGDYVTEYTPQPLPNIYNLLRVSYITQAKDFYVFILRNNVYLLAQKDCLASGYYVDFVEYLFLKCNRVKSFDIIRIKHFKHVQIALIILSIVCFIAILIYNYKH